jgi:glycosyltransferase involved in cell wall biosynthesis
MYIRLAMGLSVRRARAIIAVSESTKKDILRTLKVASDKVTTIPEALPLQKEQRELEYDNDIISMGSRLQNGYLLFIGERRPHKNLVRLILAYKKARMQLPDIPPLIIAGRSYAEYDDPEVLTNKLGLSDRVVFLNYVSDTAKNALLADASALLFPSIYEGFGLPILEAMAKGIPVITSNISSMPEIAGNAALLVDPYCEDEIAKAIELMLSDSSLRRELVERGYKRVSQFSWKKAANMTLQVYKKICSKN